MRMESVMNSKQLQVHPDKTCHLVVTDHTTENEVVSEININPMIYGNFEVKRKTEAKYLGDFIHQGGNSSSTLTTIKNRRGRVKKCIYEISAVLDDIRLQSLGGLVSGITIWNMAVLPYLLYNSEIWTDLEKECVDELEELQTLFLSALLAVPLSCPRPALAWDTGFLSMSHRITQRKLQFIVHVKKLKNKDLAKQIFDEQKKNGYPGLIKEAQELCKSLGISDISENRENDKKKAKWKKVIKEAVERKNGCDLKEKIRDYEKLEALKEEKFCQKEYLSKLSLEQARVLFRVRTRMINCKLNHSSSKLNKATLWRCGDCGNIDSQSHILHCPAYQDLRVGKNLKSDVDVANYFKEVLRIRDDS